MATSQIVVLLVALGGAREPSTRAMATAAQEALDPNALVLVREVPDATLASDARAMSIAEAVHADAVAVLTWPEADHHRAHVHVYAAKPSRWVDRDIEFRGVDAAEDRGKALGYAVATMVPLRREEPEPPHAPPPVVLPAPQPIAAPPPPVVVHERRFAVDLVGVASAGIGGSAGGFGGEASLRWSFARTLAVRLGGGLRIGEVPPANAASYVERFDGGFAWHPFITGGARPLAIGVRADFVGLLQTVTRPTVDDTTSRGSRWLAGGDALAEAEWAFVPEAGIVAGAGAEVAASATSVLVDDRSTATIPRVRILGELGLRAFF